MAITGAGGIHQHARDLPIQGFLIAADLGLWADRGDDGLGDGRGFQRVAFLVAGLHCRDAGGLDDVDFVILAADAIQHFIAQRRLAAARLADDGDEIGLLGLHGLPHAFKNVFHVGRHEHVGGFVDLAPERIAG